MEQTSQTAPERVLERIRRHQSILRDFARVSADASDLQRLLEIACQHAARAIGVRHAKLMRYRNDKSDLLVVAGTGGQPGVVGHTRLGADMASPAGRAYQTREICRIGNVNDSPGYRCPGVLKAHNIISLLNGPISVNGMVWGVIEVDSVDTDAFDEDDERFLHAFALILALGVRHRLAMAERERDAEEMSRRLFRADTLMREQNHRVRNYFQMILSIMAARTARVADEQTRSDYNDVMERVAAVALAHDLLVFEDGQSSINAATYLEALCSGFERTLGDNVHIERELEAMDFRPDRAVPLGLVVNELVTNSLKYAVKGRPDALINIRLYAEEGTTDAILSVSDNGPGMGEPRPGSMGLRLIHSLASQLSGRVKFASSGSGTTVTMIFPLYE